MQHGKIEAFHSAIPAYEEKIAELAEDKVDLIHPAGTPLFMLLGYQGKAELVQRRERQSGIPIFTSRHKSGRGDENSEDQKIREHRL